MPTIPRNRFRKSLLECPERVLRGAFLALLVAAILFAAWKFFTGHDIVNSPAEAGFWVVE